MRGYIVKRLVLIPPTLFLASLLIFFLLRVLPGDVAHVILSGGGEVTSYSQEEYAQLRKQLGLDRPLAVQYVLWAEGLLRLDAGTSFYLKRPVLEEIGRRLPVTLELAVMAWTLAFSAGVTLGILMAVRQDTFLDYLLRVISISGVTLPAFWTGSLILLVLVGIFNWMPPVTMVAFWQDPAENLHQLIFPALTIGYLYTGIIARMTRSSMLEVLRQDYMQTAWAKGLSAAVAIPRHALKNALIPVITLSGYQFGHLMAGVLVLEFLFNIPGLGRAFFEGVRVRDYPLVQALVMLSALIFVTSNFIVDIFYAWLNPRIRYQ